MMVLRHHRCVRPASAGAAAGFTLTELLVASAILIMVLLAVITAHLFGLKMISFTQRAAQTTDADRRMIRRLMEDLATAKDCRLGYGSSGYFSAISPNQYQIGNAIQIYPTAGSSRYIRYYVSGSLCRITSENSQPEALIPVYQNCVAFTFEDSATRIMTNQCQNGVVGLYILIDDTASLTYGMRGSPNHYLQIKTCLRAPD